MKSVNWSNQHRRLQMRTGTMIAAVTLGLAACAGPQAPASTAEAPPAAPRAQTPATPPTPAPALTLKLADLGVQGADPRSGGAPKHLVVLLHGYTQSGAQAYAGVVANLAPRLPNAAFLFPNAPLPQGAGFSWYNFRGDDVEATKAAARDGVIAMVQKVADAYRIPADRIVIAGFSQGGGVALAAATCASPDYKAAVSLAGVVDYGCKKEGGAAANLLFVHNRNDPTVPLARGEAGAESLRTLGYSVSGVEVFEGDRHWPAADGLKRFEDFVVAQLGG